VYITKFTPELKERAIDDYQIGMYILTRLARKKKGELGKRGDTGKNK